MWTLKFKGQPANAFFVAVNQMFGGSSQLTTTAKHCFVVWTVHNDLITARSAVVGSWEETKNIWLTVAKNAFVRWAFNFRVRMLLKSAVRTCHILILKMKGASIVLLQRTKFLLKFINTARRRTNANLTYTTSNEEANVGKQPEEVNKCPSVLSKIRSW